MQMNNFLKDYRVRLLSIALFSILTAMGLLFSVYLFMDSVSPYTYIVASLFLILTLISGFFNITTSYWYYRSYFYDDYLAKIKKTLKPVRRFPSIAIAMPVFNEDPAIVEKNMLRMREMNYPKSRLKYYLLDDSTDAAIASELRRFCTANNVAYLHRAERKGFKAGALNNMLKHSNEEFVAIFDYDEYLTDPNFIMDTLPYFGDKRMSYVQTEKSYSKGTLFSDSINLFDAFFFRFIQPARALNNTAIFSGSCGIIKRSALDVIGGFPEYIIEDTFFSFESDMNEYKSLYLPKIYALGKPIKKFSELAKQQWRYNYGDTQFLKYFVSSSKGGDRKTLSRISTIDYISHGFGLNYISGILLLFTIASILIVFSSFPIAHLSLSSILITKNINLQLEILGFSVFFISLIMPIMLTKVYFNSAKRGLMVFIINFALSFVRTKAGISAFLNLSPKLKWARPKGGQKWDITHAIKNSTLEIIFAVMLLVLGAIALIVDNFFGGLWLLWYGVLYSSTFYFFYKYG